MMMMMSMLSSMTNESLQFYTIAVCMLHILLPRDAMWHTSVNAPILLRQLKRAAVSCRAMSRFYIAVIRPVMEYAAPVWHTGLTAELTESLESVQKRALRIIFGGNVRF